MKSIALILAAVTCAGSPAIAAVADKPTTTLNTSNRFLLGKEVVQAIRADYASGQYVEFLKEMDRDYKNAKKANQLEGLIEIRKETGKVKINPEFATSYGVIQNAKNQDLLKLAQNDTSQFGDKVRSAAQSIADLDTQLLALNYKAPGSGKNTDENVLIEISLEYYYKGIHLDSIGSVKSVENLKEKRMALEMDKMDKMVRAAKHFTDKDLKSSVEDAATILDARMAKSYDTSDLLSLGKGKVKPASIIEEKAASVVSNSQGELADLHRKLLSSLSDETTK